MNGLLPRLLARVAHLAWDHPKAVIGVALMVTALAGVSVATLPVDATFMGILDEEDPAVVDLMEVSEQFGAASGLLLVIKGGEEADRQDAAQAAVEALESVSVVTSVQARVDRDAALDLGLMYLEDPEFERLELGVERLSPVLRALDEEPTLESALGAMRHEMAEGFQARSATPDAAQGLDGVVTMLRLVEQGAQTPLTAGELDELLAGGVTPAGGELLGLPLRDGFLASEDGAIYVVDVRTTLDPMNIDIGMDAFDELEGAVDTVRQTHPDQWMNFAGLLPGGFQDQQNVVGKILPLSSLSLVLVLLALLALDRRPMTPVLVGGGLLMSLVWTFALVHLVFGYASLTSLAFGILLFGLGVDYAVHVVVRFNDERVAGVAGREAMEIALSRSGRGVVIGALTTMAAFGLMVLTQFKAATHLGVTAAMGLGCALLIMVLVLPAALRLGDGAGGTRARSTLELPVIDRVVQGCLDHPNRVLGAVVLVVAFCLAMVPRFALETNLENLITQGLPAMEANEDVARAFGGSPEAVMSVSPDLETSRARAAAFKEKETVVRVEGVHDFIPVDTQARLDRNRRLQRWIGDLELDTQGRDAVDNEALRAELQAFVVIGARITAEASFGGRPDIAAKGREIQAAAQDAIAALDGNQATLAQSERVLLERGAVYLEALQVGSSRWRFGVEDLPEAVRERYVRDGKLLSYVYPADYRIDYDFLMAFKGEVEEVDPKAVGTLFIVDKLLVGGLAGLPYAVVAILLALGGILFADLRSPRKVLVALAPLVLGSAVAIGMVLALGMPVSILMMSAFPVVFGIGIDDGVHILHRFDEAGEDVAKAVAATGKAILFTSVTTSLGFSILFLLNHRGLAGMATMVLLGVTTCFVTSITVLPVLARWSAKR